MIFSNSQHITFFIFLFLGIISLLLEFFYLLCISYHIKLIYINILNIKEVYLDTTYYEKKNLPVLQWLMDKCLLIFENNLNQSIYIYWIIYLLVCIFFFYFVLMFSTSVFELQKDYFPSYIFYELSQYILLLGLGYFIMFSFPDYNYILNSIVLFFLDPNFFLIVFILIISILFLVKDCF